MIKEYIDKDNKKYYEIKNHYIGKDIFTGREKRISRKGFRTKREAENYCIKLKGEFLEVGFKSNQDYTFQDVYDLWLMQYKRKVKDTTYYNNTIFYKQHILPFFSNIKVKDIKLVICQKFIDKLAKTFKKSTIQRYRTLVNMVLDYAIKLEIITTNYMKYTDIPRKVEKSKENYYSKHELLEFLELVKNNFSFDIYCMFRVLAFTGVRRGELCALTWKDFDFKNKTLTINKNMTFTKGGYKISETKTKASNRVIYLDNETVDILKQFRKESTFLPLDTSVFNLTTQKINYYSKIIYDKLPNLKKVSVHGFRHTHATLLYESGVNIKDISNRLGHSNIKTTLDVYTHLTEDKKKDVTEKFSKFMSM